MQCPDPTNVKVKSGERLPMTVNAKAVIVEGLCGCLEKNVTKLLPTEQEWTAANRIEPLISVYRQYDRRFVDC